MNEHEPQNPAIVTAAQSSQTNTPTASTHNVYPNVITTRPATPTASPTHPTLRAQTAILQRPLSRSSGGVFTKKSVPLLRVHDG